MDKQRQDNQVEPIYNSSVLIQDVTLKTYCEWRMIEKVGGRGSGRSMLAVQHDDDDDDDDDSWWNIKYVIVNIYVSHSINKGKCFCKKQNNFFCKCKHYIVASGL